MKHHADLAQLQRQAAALGVQLSQDQAESALRYEALLEQRAVPQGLVGAADRGRLRERHLLDCLRAAAVVLDDDRLAYDLGSGAGLPGIPVAIARPGLVMALVETRRRRVAFLELALEHLGLSNARVVQGRIEDLTERADLAFARALAPLPDAWSLAEPVLTASGRLAYFAGAGASQSFVVPGARVLEVRINRFLESAGPLAIMAR